MNHPSGQLVCVGGCCDGNLKQCDHSTAQFIVVEPMYSLDRLEGEPSSRTDVYLKERIRCEDQDFYFWRWIKLSRPEALKKLLESYPQAVEFCKERL